jgi:hypothetical protein
MVENLWLTAANKIMQTQFGSVFKIPETQKTSFWFLHFSNRTTFAISLFNFKKLKK